MLYCMINVVIIEDEDPARRKLRRFLNDVQESVKVVAELTTIAEAIPFLRVSKDIDLILSDIELLDGNAFDIYNEVAVTSPIILITKRLPP
jgi:DNA-binding NarL/FixJ family response regulator